MVKTRKGPEEGTRRQDGEDGPEVKEGSQWGKSWGWGGSETSRDSAVRQFI